MTTTLYKHLKQKAPTFSDLHKKYDPVLQLVTILIGTIPNSDLVLEVWPTSFRTYNLLVSNLLNMPNSLFGNRSVKKLMGLAMYESSLGAGCNYCTAHGCSFALRRGIDESVFAGNPSEKEASVINFSRKMGAIPCEITSSDLKVLQKHCNAKEIEAVSMTIVLMGFLNKFMDVIGIELEQDAINDVYHLLEGTSWEIGKHFDGTPKVSTEKKLLKKDGISAYIKAIQQIPGAIKLEKKWLKGIPKNEQKITVFLKDSIGHDFPLLKKFKKNKLKRAFAAVLRDNLVEKNSKIGFRIKVITGLLFSSIVENKYLENELLVLAKNNNIKIPDGFQKSIIVASDVEKFSLSEKEKIAIKFTIEASKSPAKIDEPLIEEVISQLTDESIVELTTWLSILQALYRLEKLPTK